MKKDNIEMQMIKIENELLSGNYDNVRKYIKLSRTYISNLKNYKNRVQTPLS